MVNKENFIVVQGWMVTDLKLKGNELLVYACVYGFSQLDGQAFTGSLQYLADWTNTTKRNVINQLKSLVEKGFLIKREKTVNGVKFCEYSAIKFPSSEKSSLGVVKNFHGGSEKSSLGVVKNFHGGSEKSSPNNINNNLLNNIENNIGESDSTPALKKYSFGKYKNVYLTAEEYESLTVELGEERRDKAIKFLDEYIAEKGYKSDSHFVTIGRWVIDAVKEREQKPSSQNKQNGKGLTELEKRMIAAENAPITAGNSPELKERADALIQRLSS